MKECVEVVSVSKLHSSENLVRIWPFTHIYRPNILGNDFFLNYDG